MDRMSEKTAVRSARLARTHDRSPRTGNATAQRESVALCCISTSGKSVGDNFGMSRSTLAGIGEMRCGYILADVAWRRAAALERVAVVLPRAAVNRRVPLVHRLGMGKGARQYAAVSRAWQIVWLNDASTDPTVGQQILV